MIEIEYSKGEANDEAIGFWSRIFGVPASEFIGMYDSFEPHDRTLLSAKCEGKLIGSVQVYRMAACWDKGPSESWGCVGNVSTDPEFRGRKVAQTLLKEAEKVFREEWRCATGLLFTGIFDFYAQLGWRTVKGTFSSGTYTPTGGDSVRPQADIDDSIPKMIGILERYGLGGRFQTPRSERAWRTRVRTRLLTKAVYLVDQAYLVLERGDGGLNVVEAVGEPEALTELCSRALDDMSKVPVRVGFDCEVPAGLVPRLTDFKSDTGVTGMVLPVCSGRTDFEGFRLVGLDRF